MRYHLNIRNATGLIIDEEGAEFSNLKAARKEACASAADMLTDDLRGGGPISKQRIEISDDTGALVASVGFSVLLHEDCELKSSGANTGLRDGAPKGVDLATQS